ncbi:hypothetical protein [Klebsiella pneumoniae]|uniref:hypothetical protein n=1 Tax=Klebsiella pneumoniae TaxID=573 RepID=UPI001E37F443
MAVFTIFSELIGNVRDHSEPDSGFAALQLYIKVSGATFRPSFQIVVWVLPTLKRNLKKHYPEIFEELESSGEDADLFLVTHALKMVG